MTDVVVTRAELAARLARVPRPVGLVPTMGALHDGHLALAERARAENATVVVSVFVNPLQFGDAADLDRYPRTLDADLAALGARADVVWAPTVHDVYPDGDVQVRVDPGPLGDDLEGASRPGHFGGALTVVAKLFGTVRPDRAYFGEKDYQQLVLVRRMTADLDLGVDVVGVPTVREPDGLARSSRNVFLGPDDRAAATVFAHALQAGVDAARDAATSADVVAAASRALAGHPGIDVDYVAVRSPDLGPAPAHGPARLLAAARIGSVRLIDNVPLDLP
ncbi:pantoate--beta-alanine ligase [Jatrophihabitans sp. YIM 134969]